MHYEGVKYMVLIVMMVMMVMMVMSVVMSVVKEYIEDCRIT